MNSMEALLWDLEELGNEVRRMEEKNYGIEDDELKSYIRGWFEAIDQLIQGLRCEVRFEYIEAYHAPPEREVKEDEWRDTR